MHVVLLGKTGSGKTTLAETLALRHGVPLISSGAIARQMARTDDSARVALERGMMAPEEAMRYVLHSELDKAETGSGGWVLEGFPRGMSQLICLLWWMDTRPTFVHLVCPTMVCVERLRSRGREDDNPDAIARKLEHFQRDQEPLLEVLRDNGWLREFDVSDPDGLIGVLE
jgi:adenylate kinase